MGLYVEYRVYLRRHGTGHHGKAASGEKEFDGAIDVNPLHAEEDLITISVTKAAALELQFNQVATSDVERDGSAIRLMDVSISLQEEHPELCSGLVLRRVAEDSVD